MYIERVPNRNSRPAILLREGRREGKKVIKTTIANLTDWPESKVEALKKVLKDERLVSPDAAFTIIRSRPHGHVDAVLSTIKKLKIDRLISSRRCPERDLVVAMIVEQLVNPTSKLGMARLWDSTTLGEELGISDADEDELYDALDWLLERKDGIERKLAARHLSDDDHVLYDVTSSYFEGRKCALAQLGHNRDKKRGKRVVVYGILADNVGRPIGVQVYPGNTGDPSTVSDQVEKLRESFGLKRLVLIGDRGMLTETQVQALKKRPGVGWVSSLRSHSIRKLVSKKNLQFSLFDEQNLAEIKSPDFPGERLVACFNPLLAAERRRKRDELLDATEESLEKIATAVSRRTKTPLEAGEIGCKVGRVLNRYKVAKHFAVKIGDGSFSYDRRTESIRREEELDGIYVIRTSVPEENLSSEDVVRSYKSLSNLERGFRNLKGIDVLIRPIRHRLEDRVRAHIFLCMLAYYVLWHMKQALAPLLYQDETLPQLKKVSDPVLPATDSPTAKRKKSTKKNQNGRRLHSFDTLMTQLATLCRHECLVGTDSTLPPITTQTRPNSLQEEAKRLLTVFPGSDK